MADDIRALSGLRDLEHHLRGPEIPDGSPAGQLALSVILPGLASIRRVPIIGVLAFAAGVALPVVLAAWFFVNRDRLIGIALDERFLLAVAGVGLLGVVARFVSIAEIAHAYRRSPGIGGQTAVATIVVAALSVPVLLVAYRANDARSVVADVFGSGSGAPVFSPQGETSGIDPEAVTNILLLGGDAGPGRWGMRTDTMILVTIHEASGRTALVSIPRNLTRLRFPPGTPLAERFPDGFDDLANAVFTYVNGRPELVEHYGADGLQPEAVALSGGIGYSLDVEIDDFALVNMAGFSDVIDAIGGVTLDLAQSVPLPPDPEGRPLPPSIGPGVVDMDGALATAYARSRSADSDYERMGRQRQLLAALGSQVSATEALSAFGAVTGVLDDSMRTSLSAGEFGDLLDRLGDNSAIQESVGLTPPLINPGSPDWAQIRSIIDAVQLAVVSGSPSGYSN
ncbi:MAG TPA: LCP family protein [Ilumatobacter sp.]|nr:LCP family protein [Ilumatobacter sp.]